MWLTSVFCSGLSLTSESTFKQKKMKECMVYNMSVFTNPRPSCSDPIAAPISHGSNKTTLICSSCSPSRPCRPSRPDSCGPQYRPVWPQPMCSLHEATLSESPVSESPGSNINRDASVTSVSKKTFLTLRIRCRPLTNHAGAPTLYLISLCWAD